MIKRLLETFAFFRAFAVDILKFLLISAFPIVLIETSLSVYIIESEAQGYIKYVPSLLHLLYKPIYTGGFIYLMSLLVSQGNWDIRKCLSVGFNSWQNLILVYFASSVIIIAGIIAFSTGTSWGTMAILAPIVIIAPITHRFKAKSNNNPAAGKPVELVATAAKIAEVAHIKACCLNFMWTLIFKKIK